MHRVTSIFVCLIFALALTQKLPSLQMPLPPAIANPHGEEPNNHGIPPEIQRQMQKKANEQRQAEIKRDTDRLLKLSTELKEYVDKSNENVLSLDVMKKAEEIEKLARSVKNKMRGEN